jgi:peptide/nickel transport system substrate-binding protein
VTGCGSRSILARNSGSGRVPNEARRKNIMKRRSTILRRLTSLCGALAPMAALAMSPACAPSQKPTGFVIGQLQFVSNAHPLIQVNNTKLFLMGFVQRPITAFDPQGQSVCLLCAAEPTLENGLARIVDLPGGGQGMEVTIKLRPDVSWGDGTPVSAQDIAFTWRMAHDGTVGFSNYNPWTRASAVDIIDARTAVLHLPKVEAGYASWDQVLPSHLEAPIYEKYKTTEEYSKQSLYNREPANPGLWNGAYVVTSMQLGTQVTLAANPHWPVTPAIPDIILSYRSNAAALVQNLLSGDIGAVPVTPGGISFSQMLELRKGHPDRFDFPIKPGFNLERLVVQTKNPLLADVRVRQAIAHAIDREAISARLFEHLQPVAVSLLSPSSGNYSDDVPRYPFDPDKARALMAASGWKPGPDGICVNGARKRMAFALVTTAGNQTRLQIAQVIQNQLKDVCMDVSIKQAPITVYNGEEMRRRNFDGIGLSSIQFPPSTSPAFFLGTQGISTEANGWTGNNFAGYSSAAMDAAVLEVEGARQPAAAKAAWAKVQRIALEDLPIIPLYFYASAWVVPKGLVGLETVRYDQPTNWAEDWKPAR